MSEARQDNLFVRGWRNVREAGPRRLVLTAVLVGFAIFLGRYSWGFEGVPFPGISPAEQELYDSRYAMYANRNTVDQDPRVTLVVYNDQTLIDTRKRSPLDRGLLAKALRALDTMGAKAIGLDILFDQPQDEDDELIATLRAMKTPVAVGYANSRTNYGSITYDQDTFLDDFMKQLVGSRAKPASVRLGDGDGVTRKWSPIRPDLPPLLGRVMLEEAGQRAKTLPGYEGAIRYRLPIDDSRPVFLELPIQLFADPEMAPLMAESIKGRYILIGGDIVDIDRVATPLSNAMGGRSKEEGETGQDPPGISVHAEMIAQMLDGKALPAVSPLVLWAITLLLIFMAVLTGLLEWGSWRIYALVLAQFAVIFGVPIVLQFRGIDTLGVPALGWLLAWVVAFSAVTSAARASGAVERNFAQGALGKYLPKEMADEILEHPKLLGLHGEKKEIFVLFSDLEGFTKMSHAIAPEMVARLLNRYLDLLSDVVLDHGGVIDKFVGDAVVAFWGAPIARPDDGARAAKCGYAIWQAGEQFRAEVAAMDPNLPKVGKTRVGLHWGEAVVGNFGGENRIQYTALGDSMNTAARLEAANKALDSSVMASSEFAERSGLDWWRAMGRVVLRGRARPVELMEPAPDFPAEDRALLAQACNLLGTDTAKSVAIVTDLVGRYPADKALENLLHRVHNPGEGGTYVLG